MEIMRNNLAKDMILLTKLIFKFNQFNIKNVKNKSYSNNLRIVLFTIFIILFKTNVYAQIDNDEQVYYAKKEILIFKDKDTNKEISEVVIAKNITIIYDKIFKNISMFFISDEGNKGRIILTFIKYSGNKNRSDEMVMTDLSNNTWFVQFDPTKYKVLFMWPYRNPTINGMEFYNLIENISTTKNW